MPKPVKAAKGKKPVPAATRRKRLVRKLDEITSLYVRLRDGRCVQCGSTDQLTNGHLITRGHYALRWDVRPDGNCHGQCWPQNYYHEHNPHPFVAWYVGKFGLDRYEKLIAEDTPRKWTEVELQAKLDEIQGLYDALKSRSLYVERR